MRRCVDGAGEARERSTAFRADGWLDTRSALSKVRAEVSAFAQRPSKKPWQNSSDYADRMALASNLLRELSANTSKDGYALIHAACARLQRRAIAATSRSISTRSLVGFRFLDSDLLTFGDS
jgi:hypothetical protein